jgi:putative transposase
MKTVRVYRLHPSPALFARLKAARQAHAPWPGQQEVHQATRGRFALHSQSVQAVFRAFLATIETTRQLRQTHPEMRMKYPWRTKRFYPVHWPAQAVSREKGRVVLPMGKGRKSLALPLELPAKSGACTLVWNRGFELTRLALR